MKLYYCFLEKFNNYFNRKIIKYETLADYKNAAKDFFIPVDAQSNILPFDFNPNDNVTTEIIANDIPFVPDYFLLLNADAKIMQRWFVLKQTRNRQGQWLYQLKRDVISDNLNELLDAPIYVEKGMLPESDPFILNDEGMSFNQVKQEEKFIKDETKNAWIVGYLAKNTDGNDVNISIPEQIAEGVILSSSDIATKLGMTEAALTNLINYDNVQTNSIKITQKITFKFGTDITGGTSPQPHNITLNSDLNEKINTLFFANGGGTLFENVPVSEINNIFANHVIANKNLILAQLPSIFSSDGYYFSESNISNLFNLQGKFVFYSSKYYVINILEGGNNVSEEININYSTYSSLKKVADDVVTEIGGIAHIYSPTPKYAGVFLSNKLYYINFNEVSASDVISGYEFSISASRTPTADQEFDVFAIPLYAGLVVRSTNKSINFTTVSGVALKAASGIAQAMGKELYDVQLLPYFPMEDVMYGNYFDLDRILSNENAGQVPYSIIGTTSSITGGTSATLTGPAGYHGPVGYLGYTTWYLIVNAETFGLPTGTIFNGTPMTYSYVDPNGTVDSITYTDVTNDDGDIIGWKFQYTLHTISTPPDADFSITINVSYETVQGSPVSIVVYCQNASFRKYTEEGIPTVINNSSLSLKVLSNAYYIRLCSPNYQGSFDINIGKNNGKIKGYWLYGTYKPYTPYIKVAPIFEGLYGSNFGDQRGLICSGDFSLSRIIDEWQNYQLNNKNYQNIFNREIQSMEFFQKLEMRNQLVSGGIGILGDTAKGAAAGGYVGGPYGAAAGAILGGTASAIGYGIDVDTLAKTQREHKQLAIDKFNYQLGNIKALPYTLTNIGAFNINSKIYPFLEVYTPTDKELEAFNNKIKYESMTVMRIGTIREFANFNNKLNYFKGSLIRCDEIADDPTTLNAVYEELLKGVYI